MILFNITTFGFEIKVKRDFCAHVCEGRRKANTGERKFHSGNC